MTLPSLGRTRTGGTRVEMKKDEDEDYEEDEAEDKAEEGIQGQTPDLAPCLYEKLAHQSEQF